MNCANLVPITVTFIEYEKGDFFGYALAYISLSILFVISSFITLVVFRRDLHTIFAFIGMLINELTNQVLKRIIMEPRPPCHVSVKLVNKLGMPSSHSQTAWYVTAYLLCVIVIRLTSDNNSNTNWKRTMLISCFTWSTLVSYSRTYLQYHTTSQVFWGGIIGFLMGVTWFGVVHTIFTPRFPQILSWKISKTLCIKDMTNSSNFLWPEYNANSVSAVNSQSSGRPHSSKKTS